MAFSAKTKIGFRFFDEQAAFDLLVTERQLVPGYFYFVGREFHIAFTETTYRTFGNGLTVQEIINEILENNLIEAGVEEVTNQIINDLRTLITDEFVEQIVNDVTEQSILQIVHSLPHATNEEFGIVKGQDNTLPDSWHKVGVDGDGTLAINRELLEEYIDEKVSGGDGSSGGTPLDRVLAEPDRSMIGTIANRELVLQQATPTQFGVVKCGHDCACCPKPLSLKSMDGMLVAALKHEHHLFYPMTFSDRLPPRLELFDKLTFIAEGSNGGTGGNSSQDFVRDFAVNTYVPDSMRDFIKDFPASAYSPSTQTDYMQSFPVNAYNLLNDFIQDFPTEAYVPNVQSDFIHDFETNAYIPNTQTDFIQSFSVHANNPLKDFIEAFPVNAYIPDLMRDFTEEFPVNACVPNSMQDFTEEFPIDVVPHSETLCVLVLEDLHGHELDTCRLPYSLIVPTNHHDPGAWLIRINGVAGPAMSTYSLVNSTMSIALTSAQHFVTIQIERNVAPIPEYFAEVSYSMNPNDLILQSFAVRIRFRPCNAHDNCSYYVAPE